MLLPFTNCATNAYSVADIDFISVDSFIRVGQRQDRSLQYAVFLNLWDKVFKVVDGILPVHYSKIFV